MRIFVPKETDAGETRVPVTPETAGKLKNLGAGDVLSIKISKDIVDPEDVEMLEDLVLSGVKHAIAEGKELAQAEMSKITAGMGLPPGMGL